MASGRRCMGVHLPDSLPGQLSSRFPKVSLGKAEAKDMVK